MHTNSLTDMACILFFPLKKPQTNKLVVQQTQRKFLYLTTASLWKSSSLPFLSMCLLLGGFQCFPSSLPMLHISSTFLQFGRFTQAAVNTSTSPKSQVNRQSQKHQIYSNDLQLSLSSYNRFRNELSVNLLSNKDNSHTTILTA